MPVADHSSQAFHPDSKQVSAKEKGGTDGSVLITEPPGRMLESSNSFPIQEEILVKMCWFWGGCLYVCDCTCVTVCMCVYDCVCV